MTVSVLVVDDDAGFRDVARRMLDDAGLVVVGEADTVASASAAAARLRPTAILLDVMLPDGDGVIFARELTSLPWKPRVLLTSSSADVAAEREVDGSGAVAFVPKDELPTVRLGDLLRGT